MAVTLGEQMPQHGAADATYNNKLSSAKYILDFIKYIIWYCNLDLQTGRFTFPATSWTFQQLAQYSSLPKHGQIGKMPSYHSGISHGKWPLVSI